MGQDAESILCVCVTGQTLRPRRQQNLPLPKRQDRIPLPPAQEPSQNSMDNPISKTAQEGHLGSK